MTLRARTCRNIRPYSYRTLSITPFSDGKHVNRVEQLSELVALQQQLTAQFQETLGLQITEVSGELRVVRSDLAQTQQALTSLVDRTTLIEATVENGHFAPVHKVFNWIGISTKGRQGKDTGVLLSSICKHEGYRDEFARKQVIHSVYPTCGSYTYELWAWFFDIMEHERPDVLKKVEAVRFTIWPSLKISIKNYKKKYCC